MQETLFLQPSGSVVNDNFAFAQGGLTTENYSHQASLAFLDNNGDAVLEAGIGTAIAEAQSTFSQDDAFTALFSETGIVVEAGSGSFDGTAQSQAIVKAAFEVGAYETFSFDAIADLSIDSKEIDDPDTEYSKARSGASFLLMDVTNQAHPYILDYFAFSGDLISSERFGQAYLGSTGNFALTEYQVDGDIDGNNGTDSVSGLVAGRYQRWFHRDTRLALIQVEASNVRVVEDALIDGLGSDVTYGSIWDDRIYGNDSSNKIYSSLGNDTIFGYDGDDILETGGGNDRALGGKGNDKIYGAGGNDKLEGQRGNDEIVGGDDRDTLSGGRGSDWMTGGDGSDTFLFIRDRSLLTGEIDVITDFDPGVDTIKFKGWSGLNPHIWFNDAVADGRFVNTSQGTRFFSNYGGEVLFEGINVHDLSGSDFYFA